MGVGPRKPRGWHKPNRCQPLRRESSNTTIYTRPRLREIEGQKLSLLVGATHGAPLVPPAARQSHFVVAFSVQKYFGAVSGACAHPLQKRWVLFDGSHAVPVRNHEQARHNAVRGAHTPEQLDSGLQGRRDIVNRDEECHD